MFRPMQNSKNKKQTKQTNKQKQRKTVCLSRASNELSKPRCECRTQIACRLTDGQNKLTAVQLTFKTLVIESDRHP